MMENALMESIVSSMNLSIVNGIKIGLKLIQRVFMWYIVILKNIIMLDVGI
jgi:hypothetical protein